MTAARAEGFSWPEHWSPSAVDTAENVLEQRPDLAGAEWAALEQCCSLITAADAQDAVAAAAGYVATGSTGQTVAHPCSVEARLARTAAASILARLAATPGRKMTPSQRGAAGAAARWGQRPTRA